MDLSTHSPISSRGCYRYSTMAYGAERRTCSPTGSHQSIRFQVGSSALVWFILHIKEILHNISISMATSLGLEPRQSETDLLRDQQSPALPLGLGRQICEVDNRTRRRILLSSSQCAPLLVHLNSNTRLALRAVVGLPFFKIRGKKNIA